jgi:hypothetical protein
MTASGLETRPTNGSDGAGLETRGHRGTPNLRGSRSCRAAAPGNDEDGDGRWPQRALLQKATSDEGTVPFSA